MSNEIEGVIKYEQILSKREGFNEFADTILSLNLSRQELFKMKLIGADSSGLGYGNISNRINCENQFIITASQTGHLPDLGNSHYALVTRVELNHMKLWAQGAKPSSEAVTHYSIYNLSPLIRSVIHIHSFPLWEKALRCSHYIITSPSVEYGTQEMALEMSRLYKGQKSGCFVLSGHKDGLIYFGTEMENVLQDIISDYNSL